MLFVFIFCTPAYAGSVGGMGGALETTQWLNKAILEGVRESGLQEVFNTSQIVSKQIQQYATQIQELQQAVLGNLSIPFQIANDFKNSFTSLYGTIKGSGEALYSYANADKWMSDISSRSGVMANLEYSQESNKAARKAMDDIITKEESEASLAKDIEAASNSAQGATGAAQQTTRAVLTTNVAIKNSTAANVEFYNYIINRNAILDNREKQDKANFSKSNQFEINYQR